jgi:hypothetical protein
MRLGGALIGCGLLLARAAAADAVLSCRWVPGAAAVAYSSTDDGGSLATDVRALMQGIPLVTPEGETPRFPSLSAARPAHETEPLVCANREREPVDGVLELTFTRRVRLGIDYTLGRCRLFYRCPPASVDGTPVAPERLLSVPGDAAARTRDAPSD